MADNKFQVYGQVPSASNVFPTDSSASSDYSKLFLEGVKPDTLARSQDVLTPLRELTIFSVSFFNWLRQQGLDSSITDFKDAEINSDPTVTRQNLDKALTNIENALTQAITNKISAREATIPNKPTASSFLKYSSSGWAWDSNTYQLSSIVLNRIITAYNANPYGIMYKDTSANMQVTNKAFVYFDSETQDSNNNYILNLKTFDYQSNQ